MNMYLMTPSVFFDNSTALVTRRVVLKGNESFVRALNALAIVQDPLIRFEVKRSMQSIGFALLPQSMQLVASVPVASVPTPPPPLALVPLQMNPEVVIPSSKLHAPILAPPPVTWSCMACTFLNPGDNDVCGVCETSRFVV